MQVIRPRFSLMSLFLVFLTENFESSVGHCNECGTMVPRFGRVFEIIGQKICADCIIRRILR
ncbi:MAG: hypothetical protein ACFE7R_07705 [Candidatus Hodarchaeota archaeon]